MLNVFLNHSPHICRQDLLHLAFPSLLGWLAIELYGPLSSIFPALDLYMCITVLGFLVVSGDPNLSFVGCTQQALNKLITFPAVGSCFVVV